MKLGNYVSPNRIDGMVIIGPQGVSAAGASVLAGAYCLIDVNLSRKVARGALAGRPLIFTSGNMNGTIHAVLDSLAGQIAFFNSQNGTLPKVGDTFSILMDAPSVPNETFLVCPQQVITTDFDSDDVSNPDASGVLITVALTSYTNGGAAPTFAPSLSITVDPTLGSDITIWTASTALSANGTKLYMIHPAATGGAGANGSTITEQSSLALPRTPFKFHVITANADANNKATLTVGLSFIK